LHHWQGSTRAFVRKKEDSQAIVQFRCSMKLPQPFRAACQRTSQAVAIADYTVPVARRTAVAMP
jgi:hypothetical protein